MHSHIKEAPVPAYTHTPRVKFEQLSNRITNTPDVTGSPLHTCTHKHTHTVTRRLASELRLAHAHVYPALVKSLNSPRSFLKERSSRVALIQSNPSRERTKARGRREEEEGGGYDGGRWRSWERGSKTSKERREQTMFCSLWTWSDLYCCFCWRCKVCPLHCALLRCTLFLQSLCIYCDVTLCAHKASRDDDLGRLLTAGLRSFSLQLHFPPSQLHPSPFIVLHLVTAVSGVSSCSQGRGRQPACVVAMTTYSEAVKSSDLSTCFYSQRNLPVGYTTPLFSLPRLFHRRPFHVLLCSPSLPQVFLSMARLCFVLFFLYSTFYFWKCLPGNFICFLF